VGILSALFERQRSGRGQVVDAAMIDGATLLADMMWALRGVGVWSDERGANLLDGGAPFYDVYETADGRHLAVGALEPQFYDELVRLLGIADTAPDRNDPANHPELRRRIAETIRGRTQAARVEVFDLSDACVAPVIPMSEAFHHPHLAARGTFVDRDGMTQPAPAPRFSRTSPTLTSPPPDQAGQHTRDALTAWGIADVEALLASGAAVQP
jgi:alpha-methylacyl-CoA racemase